MPSKLTRLMRQSKREKQWERRRSNRVTDQAGGSNFTPAPPAPEPADTFIYGSNPSGQPVWTPRSPEDLARLRITDRYTTIAPDGAMTYDKDAIARAFARWKATQGGSY